jgi:hypothetical protein
MTAAELLRCAEQGIPDAQCEIGRCYASGEAAQEGIPKDDAKAVLWFTKAAMQGHAGAQYNLALCYDRGLGVAVDRHKASTWMKQAADKGLVEAQESMRKLSETNPFDGLDEENALRMFIYLVDMKKIMKGTEIYEKYGYMTPMIGIDDALRLAVDIAKRGVVIGKATQNTNEKTASEKAPCKTGCLFQYLVGLTLLGGLIFVVA